MDDLRQTTPVAHNLDALPSAHSVYERPDFWEFSDRKLVGTCVLPTVGWEMGG